MGRPSHRPHVVGLTAAAIALLASTAVLAGCTRDRDGDGQGDPRPAVVKRTTKEVATDPAFAIGGEPPAYRAEYRVEFVDGTKTIVRGERVTVVRPWASSLEQFATASFEGEPTNVELGTFGRRRVGEEGALVIALPPAIAPADVRFATLADAVERDMVERREQRELDGRRCQVLRSAAGLYVAALAPIGADEHIDTCVDKQGIVVEELQVTKGRPTRIRTLTALTTERIDGASLVIEGEPTDVREGGGSIIRTTADSRLPGVPFWETQGDPAGFTRRGRYVVVPPQAENFTDPTREGHRLAGMATVWERGIDALVLEQGGTLRGHEPFPPPGEGVSTADLGPLGRAEVIVSLRMNELRVLLTGGRYVRIYGTLPIAELEAFARTLGEVPGGEITSTPEVPL